MSKYELYLVNSEETSRTCMPSRPKAHGFHGSGCQIKVFFIAYCLALLQLEKPKSIKFGWVAISVAIEVCIVSCYF